MDRAIALAACGRCQGPIELLVGTPILADGEVQTRVQRGSIEAHVRRDPACAGAKIVVPHVDEVGSGAYAWTRALLAMGGG